MKTTIRLAILWGPAVLLLMVCACAPSTRQVLEVKESEVRLRSIQSRVFDTPDQNKTMRAVIATLQDLGFVVDKANESLGLVSATKLSGYVLKMTVSVRPRGESQVLVRANAQYNIQAIEDPEPYQRFFDALSQSMFLAAHQM
jgi:hypothetical protein